MRTTQNELWTSAAEAFDQRHRSVGPDERQLATPCPEFDIAALIDHVVGVQLRFAGLLSRTTLEGDSWEQASAAMASVVATPGVLDGSTEHPTMGRTPNARLLAIATNDLLIHTWDLSRALGIDDTLPAVNIGPAIEGIEAFPASIRSKLFAPPFAVGADADAQTRLLAIAGRRT
jgi:uncharacterized protein (TIGR03086 family)